MQKHLHAKTPACKKHLHAKTFKNCTMYQHKVDVDMLNAIKSVLADGFEC